MYSLKEFIAVLEEYAPLELSKKMIEAGDYDNSGVIVNCHDEIKSVLFSLDLTVATVNYALETGCDTIVTHHPAIYNPIKSLDINGETGAITKATINCLNVISMHLNLDIAENGIDACLCEGLGGKNPLVLDLIDQKHGYGREAKVEQMHIEKFVQKVKENFNSEKIIYYGNKKVEKIASFCGGGASHALKAVLSGQTLADTIITSDMAHHELLALIEKGLNVVLVPHYVSENYGFNKFYEYTCQKTNGKLKAYYFADKRFM